MSSESTKSVRQHLLALSRAAKSTVAIVADCFGFVAGAGISFWVVSLLNFDFSQGVVLLLGCGAISIALLWLMGMYRSVVRYVGLDLLAVATRNAAVVATVSSLLALLIFNPATVLRWAVVFFAFSLIYLCASRFVARLFLLNWQSRRKREQVLIYGAGAAAAELVPSLLANDKYVPVALIDDDVSLLGNKVKGVEVHSTNEMADLIRRLNVTRVLLAMPSATRRRRKQILKNLSQYPVHVLTVPDMSKIVAGEASVDEVSDVDVEDLLGRDPVPPKQHLMDASTDGKTVMVTGAGGSIGSELCRQILGRGPNRLVLIEMSEAALYSIHRELVAISKERGYTTEISALLGSVHHEDRMREILRTFRVDTIYHAAAYKHVPIVEHNLFEGIHNNIFGTLHTARAAIDCDVQTFVLVSTDKAVNPTNVMGATKRMSELILQALNSESPKTTFCMVRFGNVLESSGSVVPLFREQIRNGGPLTVTHRDIIRYFMTIPEAAQLVIQAAALARGGDVFVLDMGKPVKIIDLATRMINLMGLTVRTEDQPDGDIEIEFVGLRPAEKLYEELLIGSNVSGTEHPRIMRAAEDFLPISSLREILVELRSASTALDYEEARKLLLAGVKEYQPENGIDDLLWLQRNGTTDTPASDDGRVVDFPVRPSER